MEKVTIDEFLQSIVDSSDLPINPPIPIRHPSDEISRCDLRRTDDKQDDESDDKLR